MALDCQNSYAYNTFIFNWVQNYDAQIKLLKEAVEFMQNKVQIYNNLTYEELKTVVDKIKDASFELYNYIVVIILDNVCEYQQFIKTSDNQYVLLQSEILTRIQTNPTLKEKPRLFVIQKLLDIQDFDDGNVDKIEKIIKDRLTNRQLKQPDTFYSGLKITLKAEEYTNNFPQSPFIKVFAKKFRNKVDIMVMDRIHKEIEEEIRKEHNYKINIEFESNANTTSNLLFGIGQSSDG